MTSHPIKYFTCLLLGGVLHAQTALKPAILGPLFAGQKTVQVRTHKDGKYDLTETITKPAAKTNKVEGVAADQQNQGLLTIKLPETFANGLTEGSKVQVKLQGSATGADESESLTVGAAGAVGIIVTMPHEGDQVVVGLITGAGAADQVRVEVLNASGSIVDANTGAVDGMKKYTAGLNRRLAAGQTVRVLAQHDGADIGSSDYALVGSSVFDWGRVRAYFSAGTAIAREVKDGQSKFSSTEPYLSLNVDYNWWSRLRRRSAQCAQPERVREDRFHAKDVADGLKLTPDKRDFELARLLDALERLTKSLGTIRCTDSDTLTGDFASAKGSLDLLKMRLTDYQTDLRKEKKEREEKLQKNAGAIVTAQTTSAVDDGKKERQKLEKQANQDDPTLKRFVQEVKEVLIVIREADPSHIGGGEFINTSIEGRLTQIPVTSQNEFTTTSIAQQAGGAVIEGALYVPWIRPSWTWRFNGQDNALFIAPITKFGATVVSPKDRPVFQDANDNVYLFGSAGVRIGHVQLKPRPQEEAPELLSHLDFTIGQWDNFRTPVGPPTVLPPGETRLFHRNWRMESYGRLKIPETPLYLGYTVNFGPGPDDYRFFFGTRFDLGSLISKIVPQVQR